MDRLKNLVGIVTGGALGIGRATCLLLGREKAGKAIRLLYHQQRHKVPWNRESQLLIVLAFLTQPNTIFYVS